MLRRELFTARIAKGAATGSRYRADPAKNTTIAGAKNSTSHQPGKTPWMDCSTHHPSTHTPSAKEHQNGGLASKFPPPPPATPATIHNRFDPRGINTRRIKGETVHAR